MDVQRPSIIRPLAEIAAMSALLLSYIWGWGSTFKGDFTLCVLIYFAIGLSAHLRAREGPLELGLRVDNLDTSGRDALLAVAAIGLCFIGAGFLLGSLAFPPLPLWPRTLRNGIIWGFMQQYGLLCVYYRRFREILPREGVGPVLAASATFALLHLPNPFLTLATFGGGTLACWLYRRTPNLLVLGAMHGVISFLIVETLPDTITMGMRVGPGFWRFVPGQ